MSSNGKKVEDMILSDCSFETLKSFLSTAQFSNPWKVVFSDTDRTILMAAAKYGKYELCYHILQFRSDNINITNSKGYTALHYASYNGKSDIAQLLCGRGADIGILNNNNETPMDAALISRNFNIQQKMLSNFIFPLSTSVLFEQSDSFCCKGNIKHDIESGNRSCGKRHNYWIWNSGSDLARGRFDNIITPECVLNTFNNTNALANSLLNNNTSSRIVSYNIFSSLQCIICDIQEGVSKHLLGKIYSINELLDPPNHPSNANEAKVIDITVGRSSGNNIVIPDLSISKEHATMTFIPNCGLMICDIGSKHGTFINNIKLRNSKCMEQQVNMIESSSVIKEKNNNCYEPKFTTINIEDTVRVGRVTLKITVKEERSSSVANEVIMKSCDVRNTANCENGNVLQAEFQTNKDLNRLLYEASRRQILLNDAKRKIEKRKLPSYARMQHVPLCDMQYSQYASTSSMLVGVKRSIDYEEDDSCSVSANKTMKVNELDTNIGNSILKKMGWISGTAIGASGGVANAPIVVEERPKNIGLGYDTNKLKWNMNSNNAFRRERARQISFHKGEIE